MEIYKLKAKVPHPGKTHNTYHDGLLTQDDDGIVECQSRYTVDRLLEREGFILISHDFFDDPVPQDISITPIRIIEDGEREDIREISKITVHYC